MDDEERSDQALVSALAVSNIQPYVPDTQGLISAISACNIQSFPTALIVRTPTRVLIVSTDLNGNPPTFSNVTSVVQVCPATNVKIQSVLKR